jgi:hypothetical protein
MTTAWKVVTPGAIEVDGRLMFVGYRRPIPPKPERLARTRFIVQAVNAHAAIGLQVGLGRGS